MRECQSVSELSIREVSDGRERVERAAPPVTRGHGLALDGAGLTLGPKIIAKLSRDRLDFGALDGNACGSKAKYIGGSLGKTQQRTNVTAE